MPEVAARKPARAALTGIGSLLADRRAGFSAKIAISVLKSFPPRTMSGTDTEILPRTAAANAATDLTAAAELISTDEFSQYLRRRKSEMFAVFRGLVEHLSQITMFFNEGRDMVLTSLVGYNDNGIYLDVGASREMNEKALAAQKLFCVTQLEKVKVQFILRGIKGTDFPGRPGVFRRVAGKRAAPAAARVLPHVDADSAAAQRAVTVTLAGGDKRTIDAHIGDISGGGVGIVSLPLDLGIERGMQLDCRIELPEVGVVNSPLVVRSVFEPYRAPAPRRSGPDANSSSCRGRC